jgi:MtN3 and saliva related transmembrane protein
VPWYGPRAAPALLLVPPANAADRPSVQHTLGRHALAETLGVAAAAWGVLMAISPLLQIRRMLERRSSADVSIAYLAVLQFGFLLWIGYGISLGNPIIAIPNTVAALVGAVTMLVAWMLRHGAQATD